MRATVPFRPARLVAVGLLVVLIVAATGCSSDPGRGSVTGKITVGGKPLPKGMITFLSEVGNKDPFSSAIVNGEYAIKDMPAGGAKIYITPPLNQEPVAVDKGDVLPTARPGRGARIVVADKYQNAATSGLSHTVQKGENTFNADLVP